MVRSEPTTRTRRKLRSKSRMIPWALVSVLALAVFVAGACLLSLEEPAEYFCSPEKPMCPGGYTCNGTKCVLGSQQDASQPKADGAKRTVGTFDDLKSTFDNCVFAP